MGISVSDFWPYFILTSDFYPPKIMVSDYFGIKFNVFCLKINEDQKSYAYSTD